MQNPYYQKNGITVYLADCKEVLPELPVYDLILTDPPYRHKSMRGGGMALKIKFYSEGALDSINEFDLGAYKQLLMEKSSMFVAFCSRDLIPDYAAMSVEFKRKFDLHVWYKTNAIPFIYHRWKSDLEYIVHIWNKSPKWRQSTNALHSKAWISSICRDGHHPACKPVPLMAKYIGVLGAQSVLDPFCGSGTTLVAAQGLGVSATGIEVEEKYCEIAAKRLDALPPHEAPGLIDEATVVVNDQEK